MVGCCIFDLDGVLVDTARLHLRAWQELARGLGFELPDAAADALRGIGRRDSLDLVLAAGGLAGRYSESELERLAERKNTRYVALAGAMTPADVLPGVRSFLEELRARGIRRAVGSSSRNAALVLDRCGLRPLFDAVVDGTMVRRAKPDPELFLQAASCCAALPASCVVFEDGASGIEAAARAGMRSVGVGPAALPGAAMRISGFAGFGLDRLLDGLGERRTTPDEQ